MEPLFYGVGKLKISKRGVESSSARLSLTAYVFQKAILPTLFSFSVFVLDFFSVFVFAFALFLFSVCDFFVLGCGRCRQNARAAEMEALSQGKMILSGATVGLS